MSKIDEIAMIMRLIYETTENSMTLQMARALKNKESRPEVLKRLLKVREQSDALLDKVTHNASQMLGIDAKAMKDQNDRVAPLLVSGAIRTYDKQLNTVKRLEKTLSLRDAVFKTIQTGIDENLPIRINNREYGYREYMEMNMRTTMQHEIGNQQLEIGKKASIVFYISNVFNDAADDHRDYQGKIYYDERYKSFGLDTETIRRIEEKIRNDRMLSVQQVRDDKPWLTTRPNCRHTFTPLSLEQGLNISATALVTALNIEKATYLGNNYHDTQKQRYNERMIRKYKARAYKNEQLGYDEQAIKDRIMVRNWQARQRDLIKKNPTLQREYHRETEKILLGDLGTLNYFGDNA